MSLSSGVTFCDTRYLEDKSIYILYSFAVIG